MDKKVVIGLAVGALVVLLLGFWIVAQRGVELPARLELPEREKEVATGYSIKVDEVEAAQEAVSSMLAKLEGSPDIVFLASPTFYEKEKMVAEVRKLLPKAKLLGLTSPVGVMTEEGYFADNPKSMAVMGISVPEINWGLGGASAEQISGREAARLALRQAMSDAGKAEEDKPKAVMLFPTAGIEEDAIQGVADILGPEFPVWGAHAIDVELSGDWGVFVNDDIYDKGMAVAAIYTDLKVGQFKEFGFEITEKSGKATKTDGAKLIEIDNRPAAVVYNEWTGGALDELIGDPSKATLGAILEKTVGNYLAKPIKDKQGKTLYLPTIAIAILPDLSLVIEVEMEEGEEIVLIRGDWEVILNRMLTSSQEAMKKAGIKKKDVLFAFNTFCGGTWLMIPETERPKLSLLMNEAIAGAPFLGMLAGGPHFDESLCRNIQTNLGNGVIIFSR